MALLIQHASVIDGTVGGVHEDSDVLIEDGTITAVGESLTAPAGAEIADAHGAPVVPGYVDIHVHGAVGKDFDGGAAAMEEIADAHAKHGTTHMAMSLVTASVEKMGRTIAELADAAQLGHPEGARRFLGVHPEGPFLDAAHKGAHDPELLRDPTPENIDFLLQAGADKIAQVTLAPEREGGIDAIRALTDAGIVTSVGHTSCDFNTANEAFAAGATILTHTFNGMEGIHHRAPGPVIAALRHDNVWLEVINDGIHVHPAVVKSLFVEAPERMVLVTDAMSATCSPDGAYKLGELDVTVRDGVARLTEGNSLAGSTLTMDSAVARAITVEKVPADVAVAAATSHPARAIGAADAVGRLAADYPADVLILEPETYLPTRILRGGRDVL